MVEGWNICCFSRLYMPNAIVDSITKWWYPFHSIELLNSLTTRGDK